MRFVRAFWRFLIGVKDVLALVVLLALFGGLFVALASGPSVPSSGALTLELRGSLSEQPVETRPFDVLGGGTGLDQLRLRDVVRATRAAATDDRVKAVALDLDRFSGGGQAAISELGRAIDAVRDAGKPVIAFATGYDDASYLLASHASEVWLDPLGAVVTPGPGGTQLYFKGLLDKLGIEANVFRVGKFKSAVEPFTRTDASPEARAAEQALLDGLWAHWQSEVAKARPKARFAPYLATLIGGAVPNGTLADRAIDFGLVDRLGDRIAFGRRIAAIAGSDDKGGTGYRSIPLTDRIAANPAPSSGEAIGVVTVAGDIVDGKAPLGTAGADSIAEALAKTMANERPKALVVRIDSPGGSVTGSDRIRSAIMAAKAKGLPVVVSMGSVAASGGYWIATAGDTIFAEPSTITGSIGVFGIIPTFQNSLGKVGLSADGVGATPISGQPSLLRGISAPVAALIQAGIGQTYARFVGLVAAARHLSPRRVDEIGQGRVWTGEAAKAIGLVDRFGGLSDAIAEAARRAGVDPADARPIYVERPTSLKLRLLRSLTDADGQAAAPDPFARLGARPDALVARALGDARRIVAGPAIQVRCLTCDVGRPPTPGDLALARAAMARVGL